MLRLRADRMRLDIYLFERGLCDSRTDAKRYITDGMVTVNSKCVTKASFDVSYADTVEVDKSGRKYASRGGVKLEAALDTFSIDVNGRIGLDVGASSGGFTDCLLSRGASRVIAVDSGTGQLVESLRKDSRVLSFEGYNARYMSQTDFPCIPNIAVMDVSFISATLIIPAVYSTLDAVADFVCLVKPQFEVGRSGVGKGGIVKDEKMREYAKNKVVGSAVACGFSLVGVIESPIKGGDGNTEFLAYFKKGADT